MKIEHSVSFLLPAYNDEATIQSAVEEADQIGKKYTRAYEIIVINDGSSDQTNAILASLQKKLPLLTVRIHPTNKGYGATIKELYYKARMDWCFTIPGDYQVGAKELLKLLPHMEKADMIIGWRVNRHDPQSRLWQSRLYNGLLRLLFGLKLHDVNSVHLLKTSVLKHITITSSSAFVDAELAIHLKKIGRDMLEVPISHRRQAFEGGGGSWRTIIPTIIDLVRFRFPL